MNSSAPRPLSITPAGLAATLALAVVVGLFVRLGFWQLARLDERRDLNAGIAARLDAPPIGDASALSDTTGLFYRTISARGELDNERSIVLPGRSHRGVPGVYLLTPLLLDGRADAVLVNRGWVPSPDGSTIDIAAFDVPDTVAVQGLVLPFPDRSQSLAPREARPPAAGTFRRVWFSIDANALRAQFPYPLLPVTVQALPETGTAQRYPARLEPPPLDSGPHLGYALQWFSFALIGIIGWVALVLKRRGPARPVPV